MKHNNKEYDKDEKDDDLYKCFWVVEYLHPLNLQVLIESYSERQ